MNRRTVFLLVTVGLGSAICGFCVALAIAADGEYANVRRIRTTHAAGVVVRVAQAIQLLQQSRTDEAIADMRDFVLSSKSELDSLKHDMNEGDLYYFRPAEEFAEAIKRIELTAPANGLPPAAEP